jgi:phage terminase large subunit-like protein
MADRDYAGIAMRYAQDVVSGTQVACKWVVAACLRQLRDLGRQCTPDFPFRYEPERGAKVCLTVELLPHIKGRWSTRTIRLEPWQIFLLMVVFSWVWAPAVDAAENVRAKDGLRRFRTAYIEVARKNTKSTMTAGVGAYMLAPDNEQGAECYSAATTRDQARIVFDIARAMIRKTPGYRERFGVEVNAHTITVPGSDAFFRALSADDDSLDGLNPHFASVDELHAHKSRGVWDVLETATGARDQSLLWTITTAGGNRSGICYEVRTYVTQILTSVLLEHPAECERMGYKADGAKADDESFFGIIYTIDDEGAWTDPREWAKANPNLGVSVRVDDLERKCRKAQQLLSAKPSFLTKHLNVWINADSPWMDMAAWARCADRSLKPAQFTADPCFVAFDLASKVDIAARIQLHRREVDGRMHYYAFGRFYLPEEVIEESENSQYRGWEEAGWLTACDGATIDQNQIQDDLRELRNDFNIRAVGYDPFQAKKFADELEAEGFPMVEVGATVKNFSEPMKTLGEVIADGRFHHDGNPALEWMVSNIVAHVDRKDNIFPARQTLKQKIDGGVALIMAMERALFTPDESGDWLVGVANIGSAN